MVWAKRQQSLAYIVEQDFDTMDQYLASKEVTFNNLFETVGRHPPLLKLYIKRRIHLETIVICDMVLGFTKHWDKVLKDPLWEQLSFKIKKYKPFLSIPSNKYKVMMQSKFCGT